jgi:hypothetical protein
VLTIDEAEEYALAEESSESEWEEDDGNKKGKATRARTMRQEKTENTKENVSCCGGGVCADTKRAESHKQHS